MTIRRVTVKPGVTVPEMKDLWNEAKREAISDAGQTVALLFGPGEYPMPDAGEIVYKDVPTPLRVSPPGIEVRFRLDKKTARLRILAARPGMFKDLEENGDQL
jgi:hypothetical protein